MMQNPIDEILSKIDDRTRLLRLKEVIEIVGMKRSTIYEHIQASSFPRPINIGPRAVAWLNTDIQAWIAQRVMSDGPKRL
jgi:prophage regulatory protein